MTVMRRTLAGLCLACTAPALAQEVRTDLRFGATTEYESNLLRLNRLRGGGEKSDVRLTPTLDVDVVRRIVRDTVRLNGSVGYDFYRRNKALNNARIALDARGTFGLGAFCTAKPFAGIDVRQTDVADLGQRVGNSTRQQEYGVEADCTRRAGLSPTLSANYTTVDNSRASRDVFDLRAYNVLGGVGYTRPSLGTFDLLIGRERITHPRWLPAAGGRADVTVVDQFGGGFRRSVSPRLAANVRVLWLDAKSRAAPGYSGIGWTSALTWTPWPRLSIEGALDRGVRGQGNFGSSYSIATQEHVTARYTTGFRSGVSLSVSHRRREFRGETALLNLPTRGADTAWTVAGNWHYDPLRRVRILAGADYRQRDSRNAFYDFSSFAANLGLRVRL